MTNIRLIKHEAIPDCGSYEVHFPDGQRPRTTTLRATGSTTGQLLHPDQRITVRAAVEPHNPTSLAVGNTNKEPRECVTSRTMGRRLLRRRMFVVHHVVLRSQGIVNKPCGDPTFPIPRTLAQLQTLERVLTLCRCHCGLWRGLICPPVPAPSTSEGPSPSARLTVGLSGENQTDGVAHDD